MTLLLSTVLRHLCVASLLLTFSLAAIASPPTAPGSASVAAVHHAVQPPPGSTVVVGIHPSPPFVIEGESGRWSGLSIDLWRLMAEEAGLRFQYKPMKLTALFQALDEGSIDLAVGALSMSPEREKQFDFTHPFFISGLGIAVSNEPGGGLSNALSGLFSPQLLRPLLLVSAWLLLSGLLVWLFERRRNPEMFGGNPAQGVGSGFWWALVTLTTVGYGDKSPITLGGRMVALVWMMASLVILSSLTAAITASLTVSTLQSAIQGPDDLRGKRVATVSGSTSADWLQRHEIGFDGQQTLPQALDLLQQGQVDAVVYDAPILSYALQQRNDSHISLLNSRFHQQFNAFALPPDSPYLEALNYAILDVIRSRQWQHLRQGYLGHDDDH